MLRAIELLKKDLKSSVSNRNKLDVGGTIFNYYSDHQGIPKGRIVHVFGHPDCGKTQMALNMMKTGYNNSYLYISKKLDDIRKVEKVRNVTVLNSNIFEDTISYLESIDKDMIDVVIIDDINNMLSKEELMSAFTKKLDDREILNKYIKKISLLAAQKQFVVIVFNGINLITNKSRYSYIIEREAIASFCIEKLRLTKYQLDVKITPVRNLLSNIKDSKNLMIVFKEERIGRYERSIW